MYPFLNSGEESCSSHLFGVVPSRAAQTGFVPELSKAITFCLRSYPGEISHSNSAKRELSNDVSLLEVLPRKVALHTSSHLTPIEAWRSAVSTISGHRVSSEVWLENCTQVWGWAKFGQRATHSWGKIVLHTCSDLSKPVRFCLNLSTIQWPCTLVAQSFFALLNALILWSYVVSWWNCIF